MRTKDFFREILLQITSMAIEIVSISMKEGSKSIQVVVVSIPLAIVLEN